MPLHPCFADKLHLLEGIVSIEAALADPAQEARLAEFFVRATPSPRPSCRFGTTS